MDALLIELTAAAYLIAAGSLFLYLFRGNVASRLPAALLLGGFIVHSITLGCFDILRPVAAGSASLSRNEAYGAEKIASCRQTGFFNRIGTKQTCCNVL